MKIKITTSRFINMCKNLIPLNDKDYLPVEDIATIYEMKVNTLKSYEKVKHCYGNDLRFKRIDGKLYVHKNYKALLKEELEQLYYKALIVARTQSTLAKDLSKILKIKPTTLMQYFNRFNFKQIQKAQRILEAMKKYINQNSLLSMEQLNYEA